MVTPSG
ncbi:hypothetical protein R3I94_005015 [Phoxinus phoxinus]